ncbi:hypothetical protein KZ383_10535 [Glaesserella parasuis]|nr:hypothetical protein [Glaesserella parasuis]MCT8728227.1 hypothetical protein [Glaesserella parasuis]MDE3995191.1 hypothetical protein [Glaesserella parasuis]MDE4012731.1 hypothetical protein [Glaesserella parasuis]MDO9778538.1 hypothetical protein [Glaesserella parasuis]
MGDVSHQYFNGSVGETNGIKIEKQTKVEIHQHFISPLDRKKLTKELMGFKSTDPQFFKALQDICTQMRGDFMFIKFNDEEFLKFYEIKNILFSFYQEKENHRLSLSEEKSKVTKLEMDLAIEKNRVALFQQETKQTKSKIGEILKRVFG